MMNFAVGQVVEMKKTHPCGANNWRIIRIGMDFRIKCLNCGRSVLIARSQFEKRFKRILQDVESENV